MRFSIILCCSVSLVVLQRLEGAHGFTNPTPASYKKFQFLMQGVIAYEGGLYGSFPVCMVTRKFGVSSAHIVGDYLSFMLKRGVSMFPGKTIHISPSTIIEFPNIRFDVSVWQLERAIPSYVNVIPVSYSGLSPTVGENLIAVGLETHIPFSENLSFFDVINSAVAPAMVTVEFINVHVVPIEDGAIWYDNFPTTSAGRSDNSSDVRFLDGYEQTACAGNSGSSVLREIPGFSPTRFELIGIVSFGKDNCSAYLPFGIFDVTEQAINRYIRDTINANS